MIDLEKATKEFIKYTDQFDIENANIDRKIKHSFRVMEIIKDLAQKQKLSKDDIEIATLIGLLHDTGRFEQYTKYKTYNDNKSVDHAKLGVKILFEENKIKKFLVDEKYYKIIEEAITNHNKYKLETKELSEKEELFCKMIRDADKIDILYEGVEIFWNGEEKNIEESIITNEVWENFVNGKLIENNLKKTAIDKVIGMISFVYDINLKESLRIIKEKDYINKIINRFEYKEKETKEKMNLVKDIVEQYLQEKIK